jgi:hypothetical protein
MIGGEPARRTQLGDRAPIARRGARRTDPPSVGDERVREENPIFARQRTAQVVLDLHRIVLLG